MKKVIKLLNIFLFPIIKTYWLFHPRKFNGAKMILTSEEDFLLVKHTFGSDKWKFPGGQIKNGEKPLECVLREVREELNINLTNTLYLGLVAHSTRRYSDKVHIFTCEINHESSISPGIEIDVLKWFPKKQPPLEFMSEITKKAYFLLET